MIQRISHPNKLAIVCMLDRLNKAKSMYDAPSSEQERQEADKDFADCLDWFIKHEVPTRYDEHTGLHMYAGLPIAIFS